MSTANRTVIGERVAYVKTKIVATVGPASASFERLHELVLAGVDLFRLNFAHGDFGWLEIVVQNIRRVSEQTGRVIGILGDLSGPKIRLMDLPDGKLSCPLGARFEFARDIDPNFPERLACTYEPLVDELNVDDLVMLADGTVAMRVVEKFPDEHRIVCEVEQDGEIRSRQGINLPGVQLSTPSLTEKDREDLTWAIGHNLDYVGLSFVRSADDVALLRNVIDEHNSPNPPQIVSKIEKIEAVNDLDRILEMTDAVMVARGDLGVEVDIARVPGIQKRIIRLCNERRVPVITATQMLDSMERNSRPTRAEASDVANAVLDGSDAVMLSGETAIGQYPTRAVSMMSRLAHEAERLPKIMPEVVSKGKSRTRALAVTEAVTYGASKAAELLEADLIVVATHSGRTALSMSERRSAVPIVGLSDSLETARRMSLYWGVTPLQTDLVDAPPQELLAFVVAWARKEGVLQSGNKLVLVSSSNWSAEGHDLMLVHAIP